MKTTVKIAHSSSISVNPIRNENAVFVDVNQGGQSFGFGLTPDQAGALIFGLEQALEAAQQRQANPLTLVGA